MLLNNAFKLWDDFIYSIRNLINDNIKIKAKMIGYGKETLDVPEKMQNEKVRPYYDSLEKQKTSLVIKRVFDIVCALLALIVFLPIMLVVAVAIKLDSPGAIFFRQERITVYGKKFRIWKFRSMVSDAEKKGYTVT